MTKNIVPNNSFTELLLYTTPNGQVKESNYTNIQFFPFWNIPPINENPTSAIIAQDRGQDRKSL